MTKVHSIHVISSSVKSAWIRALEMTISSDYQVKTEYNEEIGVDVGHYVDVSDSLHIYGRDLKSVERVFDVLAKRKL